MLKHSNHDLIIMQLLVGRLCHDLVNPIGTINNAVELIKEEAQEKQYEFKKEVFDIINISGKKSAAYLRLFRLVYGTGGMSADLKFDEARLVFIEYLAFNSRIKINWPTSLTECKLAVGGSQAVLALAMLAYCCLPRGGTILITTTSNNKNSITIAIEALGVDARLPPGTAIALAGDTECLDYKSIHAYFCWQILSYLNSSAHITSCEAGIKFTADLPLA